MSNRKDAYSVFAVFIYPNEIQASDIFPLDDPFYRLHLL